MLTTTVRYSASFPGRPEQVRKVRRAVAGCLAGCLAGCPRSDDAVLIASELAANAIRHSASSGAVFAVRVDVLPGYVLLEVGDLGGPWLCRQQDGRPHGLDIVATLAGSGNWGTRTAPDGSRVVWARIDIGA